MFVNGVEVYSVNLDFWINIEVDFTFTVSRTKCDLIVNGNPYWISSVYSPATVPMFTTVLVCFDVTKLVFKVVPLSDLYSYDVTAQIGLTDYNGCLGALMFARDNEGLVKYLDVWVFHDSEQVWRKDRTCGRIEVNVLSIWHWTKNGKIIGERTDGQLFLFDPETRCVRELLCRGSHGQRFVLQRYTENLTYIEGMKPVKARKRRKMIDDAST
ncbi:hypothetical protein PHJA_002640500 [Phtheirospermum japonicum]|uniref:F-box associated beta-propeller type 3 domain-containing protein n=1 Tax=Phtheirospermum japonicum TaxID=374723 RepID=A0A830D9T7_9LAMI|nr:hypothetical protein PHJA_002640500 [Phtheirospermum japonicum]